MKNDRFSLICDLAQYYNIHDYTQYPLDHVATLASGLPPDSRVFRGLNNFKNVDNTILIAGIYERLDLLLWSKTKDGQKNRNRPKSIIDSLSVKSKEKDHSNFTSAEDFEKRRQEIIQKIEKGGT